MDNIKILIQNARTERELGDPKKALELFLNIKFDSLSETQVYDYLGELGLTYFHLQDFENSKKNFDQALEKARTENKKTYQALFLRHLARKEFNLDSQEILKITIEARNLAFESARKDLVWFDQGVITALINANAPEKEINEWFAIESQDLLKASREVNDDQAIWVWMTGILIERYQFKNDISNLNIALLIAEKFKLARRIEQINNLLNKTL